MDKNLVKTIRLNAQESQVLKNIAFDLSKKNIMNDINVLYRESDLIHVLIEDYAHRLDVDASGKLILSK
ncbi:hypothetical protein K3012_003051 [Salmonella enterica]|nr:hypothetical protein [Salmonella enterica]EJZ7717519.1 hypothetical protein [Salmonella enterica]HAX4198975.1 hypothetical protein [Escherichia coli]HAX4336321.1 hypothetical protein [Escherichia coli]